MLWVIVNCVLGLAQNVLHGCTYARRMTAKLTADASSDDILKIFELRPPQWAARPEIALFDNDGTGTVSLENLMNIANIIGAKESPQEIQDRKHHTYETRCTSNNGQYSPNTNCY
eukprot:3798733-Amphidinium_carterae.1